MQTYIWPNEHRPLWPELHGPLPEERCFILLALPDGAKWLLPVSFVIDNATAYYEEQGWYCESELEEEGLEQPTGDDLRGLVAVNNDHVTACCEIHWREARPHARHLAGPKTLPSDDLLWSVDETGGTLSMVTTLSPEEQLKASPPYWMTPEDQVLPRSEIPVLGRRFVTV